MLLPRKILNSSLNTLQRRCYAVCKNRQNQGIIDLLQKHKHLEEEQAAPNTFKIVAFAKAIQTVSALEKPIRSGNDVTQIRGIGPKIAARIDEHIYSEGDVAEDSPEYQELLRSRAIHEMQRLPGIGPTRAKKLVEAGALTLNDLRSPNFFSMLNKSQRVYLEHRKWLGHTLQRQDVEDVLAFCRDSLDPKYELILVGDYRRGSNSCDGIQLMVLHPNNVYIPFPLDSPPHQIDLQEALKEKAVLPNHKSSKRSPLSSHVVPLLSERSLFIKADTLSENGQLWRGFIRLPGRPGEWGQRHARHDAIISREGVFVEMAIHFVAQKARGAALLSLTGDRDFHKSLVERAKQMGMLLNEHGLWKWNYPDSGSTLQGFWSLVKCESEEDVFVELGMDPVDPTRRNYRFLSMKRTRKKT